MSFSKSVSLVSAISFASVLVSLAYTLFVANVFGVGREVEIYFAASQVFSVFVALSQSGQLVEAFIPIFHKIKVDYGLQKAFSAFSVVLNWIAILASVLALLIFLASDIFVAILVPGFDPADQDMVAHVVMLFAPLILLQVTMAFMKGLATAESIFGWTAALNLGGSLINLIAVVFFYRFGLWALVYGLIIGVIFQFIGILLLLLLMGYRHQFVLRVDHFDVSVVFRRLMSTSIYALSAQTSGVLMTSVLSVLPQGTYGAYNYALRIFSKAGSVLMRPISTVFFTQFSEAYARGEEGLRQLGTAALNRTLLNVSVAVLALMCSGSYMLNAVLRSDSFPADKVALSTLFLTIFIFSFVATGMGMIARLTVVTIGKFDLQYYLFSAGQLINALLIFILVPLLGTSGVVLVIILNYFIPALISGSILYSFRPELLVIYDRQQCAKWLVVLVLPLALAFFAQGFLPGAEQLSRIINVTYGSSFLLAVFVVAFFLARILRIQEVEDMANWVRGKIRRESK